jgi:hypothetical protein
MGAAQQEHAVIGRRAARYQVVRPTHGNDPAPAGAGMAASVWPVKPGLTWRGRTRGGSGRWMP